MGALGPGVPPDFWLADRARVLLRASPMALLNLVPGAFSHTSVCQTHVRPAAWAALTGHGAGCVQAHSSPRRRVVGASQETTRRRKRGRSYRCEAASAPVMKAFFLHRSGSRPPFPPAALWLFTSCLAPLPSQLQHSPASQG